MLRESSMLRLRWVRTVPHIVDTLLLASALTMAVWIGQYPFVQGWLTAKFVALVLYVGLGTVALRMGKTKAVHSSARWRCLRISCRSPSRNRSFHLLDTIFGSSILLATIALYINIPSPAGGRGLG